MPKKTKKQKLHSEKRKSQPTYHIDNFNEFAKPEKENNNTDTVSFKNFLLSDLRKTLALTTLAIIFELVLYWWWR